MPTSMLNDPAQQSANRTATRSELSSNWRKRIDAPPRGGNNAVLQSTDRPSSQDYFRRRDLGVETGSRGGRISGSHENSREDTLRGEDDPRTLQAIDEGRRLYVGNMSYIAKTKDVEETFALRDYQVEHINMSIDPYSGRNPSYCFVELATKEQADRALLELDGKEMLGRPLKLGPGVARSRAKRSHGDPDRQLRNIRDAPPPVFDRWIRTDAADHWKGYSEQGRRLFVGGLPRMPDHNTVNSEVRKLFEGFRLEAVSKVVIPRTPAFGDPSAWNHRYLFVDFPTADEAARAAKATNGRQAWGVKIRVLATKPPGSRKTGEREAWEDEQLALSREDAHSPNV